MFTSTLRRYLSDFLKLDFGIFEQNELRLDLCELVNSLVGDLALANRVSILVKNTLIVISEC